VFILVFWPKVDKKMQNKKITEQAEIVLNILGKVREHKTKNNLAMNAELESFELDFKPEKFIADWLLDLQKVTGVKKFLYLKK